MARGYAYVDENKQINIRTVSDTRLAAMVNAIVLLSRHAVYPRDNWSDEMIERVLGQISSGKGRICRVTIQELAD